MPISGNIIRCPRLHFKYDAEEVILSFLNLHVCPFIWFFKWMFFSSVKEISRLISKGMLSIYLKVKINVFKTLIF